MSAVRAWRLSKRKYAVKAFTGEGSAITGGRWNTLGVPVVYSSLTLSLAVLEVFVHMVNRPGQGEFVYTAANLPIDLREAERVDVQSLPANWKEIELPALKLIGDEWAASQRSLALLVPSVIIPEEWNIVLNPLHPRAASIELQPSIPFHFDQRLFTTRI